jgi:hypothetical protein
MAPAPVSARENNNPSTPLRVVRQPTLAMEKGAQLTSAPAALYFLPRPQTLKRGTRSLWP